MKLMKRLMRKNNKGMSLVELICAVAILGLTTTALGGAMVMSAQHYYRDSAEFEVQQDAQTATNLINNLVTDAADAEWADDKLTITADDKTHVIYQDGDKLVYENTSDGTKGVLAEGLPANAFEADTSNFDSNKSVNVSLTVKNGDTEFTSNSNATSRNGELSTAEFAEKVCVISAEELIVIEPNQSYEMDVELLGGMTIDEVGGITLDRSAVLPGWDDDNYLKYDADNKKVILLAPPNANGHFQFKLSTGNKADGTPWDTHEVTVRVRRVSGISINNVSGDGFTAGSEYVFASAVVGDNLSKCFGREFDYDYKNPKWVKFEVSGVAYEVVPNTDNSKSETPNITIRLTEDMAPGSTFSVTAISYHAAIGQVEEAPGVFTKYNKTGVAYNTGVKQTWTSPQCPAAPAPTPTIDPNYPLPDLPSGMLRGEDYSWGLSVPNCDTLKGTLATKYNTPAVEGFEMHYEWFVSFKERDNASAVWTPWHMTCQAGNNQKIDGTFETTIMLPDKAYDLRFFILYYDKSTKKVFYPHDEDLLAPGNGLYEAGFKKGWADEDAAATDFMQYGKSTMLPATSLYYYNESDINTHYDNMNSLTNPITYKYGDSTTPKVYFNMRHLSTARTMYTYTPVVWKYNTTTKGWDPVTDLSKIMKCEINNGSPRYIEFKEMQNYANSDDLKNAACGIYRIGFELGGTAQKYKSVAADSVRNDGFESKALTPMKLYDEANSKGFIYFKIEK